MSFLIALAIYFSIGASITGVLMFLSWYNGNDVTVGDIGRAVLVTILWPTGMFLLIVEAINRIIDKRDSVVISGKASSKVLKALKDSD